MSFVSKGDLEKKMRAASDKDATKMAKKPTGIVDALRQGFADVADEHARKAGQAALKKADNPPKPGSILHEWDSITGSVENILGLAGEGVTHAGNILTAGARIGQRILPFETADQLAEMSSTTKHALLLTNFFLVMAFLRYMPASLWKFFTLVWLLVFLINYMEVV